MTSEIVTLKQKIISTDKLIREFKNSKFDSDTLRKKNEELTRLIDKLHRDLSARNTECAKLLGEVDPLKKAISKFKQEAEVANKEAFRWRAEVEANKVHTEQLVEKVKYLEKLQEDSEPQSAKNKELSKLELKIETLKDQYKEAKEALGKTRKDLKQLQTKHKQLVKHAITFGKVAVTHGKLTVTQKRFYQKLSDGTDGINSDEEREIAADVSSILDDENEMQSKMLEDLLTSDNVRLEEITLKIPVKTSKTPQLARSSDSKLSSASPSGKSTARKVGRPKKLNVVAPSPEKETETKEDSRVSLIETSDTDATIGSDHELTIKGISRIRTRSMSKSISSPERSLSPVKVKREKVSMPNILDDESSEEPALKTTPAIASAASSANSIAKVEDDLNLSSSSDEDEEIDNMASSISSILPMTTVEQPQQESPARVKDVPTAPEVVPTRRKISSSEQPKSPECHEMNSDTSSTPLCSPKKVENLNETVSALSIFDNDTPVNSPAKPSDGTDFSLELTRQSADKREPPGITVETVNEVKAKDVLNDIENTEVVDQDARSGVLDSNHNVHIAVTSSAGTNNEKTDGEIPVKGLDNTESEVFEGMQEEGENKTTESKSVSSDLVTTLKSPESEKKSCQLTSEANSDTDECQVMNEHVLSQETGIVGNPEEMTMDETVEKESETIADLPSNLETSPSVTEVEPKPIDDADFEINIDSKSDNDGAEPGQHDNAKEIGEAVPQKSSRVLLFQNESEIMPAVPLTAMQVQPVTIVPLPLEQYASNDSTNQVMDVTKEPQLTEAIPEEFGTGITFQTKIQAAEKDNANLAPTGINTTEGSESNKLVDKNVAEDITSEMHCSVEVTSEKKKSQLEETKCKKTKDYSPAKPANLFEIDSVANKEVAYVERESRSAEEGSHLAESDFDRKSEGESQQAEEAKASLLFVETDVSEGCQTDKVIDENVDKVATPEIQFVEASCTKTKASSPVKSASLFEIDSVGNESVMDVDKEPRLTEEDSHLVVSDVNRNSEVESQQAEKAKVSLLFPETDVSEGRHSGKILDENVVKIATTEIHFLEANCTRTKANSPGKSVSLFETASVGKEKVLDEDKEPKSTGVTSASPVSDVIFQAESQKAETGKANSLVIETDVSEGYKGINVLNKHVNKDVTKESSAKATSPAKCGSLFEIDEPSSTSSEPKTLAAVQVQEIHSSPTKPKLKKAKIKETGNEFSQSDECPEPFRSTPSSAFVSAQSEACNFKVPAVPPLPAQKDHSSNALMSTGKRSRPTEGKDGEISKILREARKLLTDLPRVLSPLPEPPKPKPSPKHAMIPRCAFNWMGKKLPISTELTEQFGAYVKPGVRVRVRFRRVSRKLRDLRAPGTLSHLYHGVANYAEAEKKSRRHVDPNAPLIDDAESAGALGQSIALSQALTQAYRPSENLSSNGQKEVASVIPSKTPNPVGEDILQDLVLEPPVLPIGKERSQKKSKFHKKSELQVATAVVPNQTSGRVNLESANPVQGPRENVAKKMAMVEPSVSNSKPSLEKRPRLVLDALVEPAERLQRADPNQLTRPTIPPSLVQQLPERVQLTVEETSSTPKPTLEKRPRLMLDTPQKPVESLHKIDHNQPLILASSPSQSATGIKLRSNEDLFGSDTNSEDEPEQPAASAQPRLLPRMITRPTLTSALVKPRRLEVQHARPFPSPEPLIRTTPRSETFTPRPVRPVSIVPCSDAILSAVAKAKFTPRMVASRKQSTTPDLPLINTPERSLDQDYVPLGDPLSRKRIAHAPKRPLEVQLEDPDLASPLKKAKIPVESTPTPSYASALPTPIENSTQAVGSSASSTIAFKIRVRRDVFDASQTEKETSKIEAQSLRNTSLGEESIEGESLTINESPASPTPMETVGASAEEDAIPLDTPRSPVSTPSDPDSPQSPPKVHRNLPDVPVGKPRVIPQDTYRATEIPTEVPQPSRVVSEPMSEFTSSTTSQQAPRTISSAEHLPPYLEVLLNDSPQEEPTMSKCMKKIKTTVRQSIEKVCKAEELTDDIFNKAVRGLTLGLVAKHPFIIIRHFVSTVIHASDADVDLTYTPPLPPLPLVHQRCIALLLTLDEKNREFEVDLEKHSHRYSNYFLSEASYSMFRPESAMTIDEMSSLARAYVALCRAIGDLQRARSFLFDCLYFYPPFGYALAYVIITLWGEILRPVTFATGASCVDQTIAFLLLFCNSIKAADGTKNRITSLRTLLQNVYGYKGSVITTVPVLVDCLMKRFKDTQNSNEAANLSWCLALVGRWQGVGWAINTIEKVLWPFLQRWSAGEGTNAGAVAAITSIGLLGKRVPVAQRTGVDMVFGAMKALLCSADVPPPVAEAAIETAILLGSETKTQAVFDIVKEWRPKVDVSGHLQNILKAFLKKYVKSENSLVNDAKGENNSYSE